MTATSASIQEGVLMVENDSNLGAVTIATAGSVVIDFGATVTATSVETSGFLIVSGADPGNGEPGRLRVASPSRRMACSPAPARSLAM